MQSFSLTREFRDYVGKVRTLRDQRLTERFLEAMPADLRRDIAWPDRLREVANRW